jgi:hypothetical protein
MSDIVIRPPVLDDNSDGIWSPSDGWNNNTAGNIAMRNNGHGFKNFCAGQLLLTIPDSSTGYEDPVHSSGIGLNHTDGSTYLSTLQTYFQGANVESFQTLSRNELIDACLIKVGGPLDDGSWIGATGTTRTNGPYNWIDGHVNTNGPAPVLISRTPDHNDSSIRVDPLITIRFDQEIQQGNTVVIQLWAVANNTQIPIEVAPQFDRNRITWQMPPLEFSTLYEVIVPPGSVMGFYGNSYSGLSTGQYRFTTRSPITSYADSQFTPNLTNAIWGTTVLSENYPDGFLINPSARIRADTSANDFTMPFFPTTGTVWTFGVDVRETANTGATNTGLFGIDNTGANNTYPSAGNLDMAFDLRASQGGPKFTNTKTATLAEGIIPLGDGVYRLWRAYTGIGGTRLVINVNDNNATRGYDWRNPFMIQGQLSNTQVEAVWI